MDHFKYKDFSNNEVITSWPHPGTTSVNPDSQFEAQAMHRLLTDLTQAVLDFGPNKSHHMKVLVRHRTEWPFLWEKIDSIVSFIASSDKEETDE
jgi:hypothetical protein